ncbi:hypothetical protein [Haloarcula regularis]|uniref:hypothetical protein n=2 Tax=Haloarcula TaxID=2237 RepID=UPI0023E8DF65|nr:hypothetical protein [Halomicroarcula sp. SYNS111]
MTMNPLSIVLALVVALAGCIGFSAPAAETPTVEPPAQPPTGTDTQTPRPSDTATPDGARTPDAFALEVAVESDGPFHLTVHAVAPENTGLRVYYADDSSRTFAGTTTPDALPADTLDGATGVEPTSQSATVSIGSPDGTGGVAFSHPGGTSTVLYSVSDADGDLLAARLVECDPGTVSRLDLVLADGQVVASGYQCLP